MRFSNGDQVEVCMQGQGFWGSFYEATVMMQISKSFYIVEYKNLLREDESGPLTEIISGDDMRPKPPEIPLPSGGFSVRDEVDGFDNDGWWIGKITRKKGSKYRVYFITTGEKKTLYDSQLRVHLDWIDEQWISSN